MKLVHSHIGICVLDAARSELFYVKGLGFEAVNVYDISGPQISKLTEIKNAELHGRFVKLGGLVLELLQFNAYAENNTASARPMNRNGMTHLAFEVDDVTEVRERIVEFGGTARLDTLVEIGANSDDKDQFGGAASMMCTDPDGTRIELLKSPGSPRGEVGTRMCWQLY